MTADGAPIPLIIEEIASYIRRRFPLSLQESRAFASYLYFEGRWEDHFLTDIEPPIPFRFLSPRGQWRAFKMGLPQGRTPEFWNDLAWAILHKLAGL